MTRPTMRFVAVKSEERQAALMLHKTRDPLIRQRTMLINALRGHLYEFGVVVAKGAAGAKRAVAAVSGDTEALPALARASLRALADQLEAEIAGYERRILAWHRANETSRRLATIPGVGPITATAIAASVPDPSQLRSGRQFAAGLGLTPRACSSGGKERQARIGKMGDGYIRRLLVVGATAMPRIFRRRGGGAWITALMARKKPKAAAVALANKTARVAWALMARGEEYRPTPV